MHRFGHLTMNVLWISPKLFLPWGAPLKSEFNEKEEKRELISKLELCWRILFSEEVQLMDRMPSNSWKGPSKATVSWVSEIVIKQRDFLINISAYSLRRPQKNVPSLLPPRVPPPPHRSVPFSSASELCFFRWRLSALRSALFAVHSFRLSADALVGLACLGVGLKSAFWSIDRSVTFEIDRLLEPVLRAFQPFPWTYPPAVHFWSPHFLL